MAELPDPTNYGNAPGEGPLRPGGQPQGPQKESDLPSSVSAAAQRQSSALRRVRDLEAGPERIEERGTEYLPRNQAENPQNYSARLARSVLFNFYAKAVRGLTGFVFRRDPKLSEDVPPAIVEAWENIDLAGTHGDVFAREQLQDTLVAGHSAILVDFPNTGGTQTAAQEMHIRPYWVPIKKDNILSWRTTNYDGRTILTQIVLKECAYVPDGAFGEVERTQYRVFHNDNGIVRVEVLEVTKNQEVVLVAFATYPTQEEIPIAEVISSGRKSMFESDPPLIDLAYLNIAHYQNWSDYAWASHMSNTPLLFGSGIELEEGATLVSSANSAVLQRNPDAKLGFISHDGAALSATKELLDDLKSDMATLSLAMLANQKRTAETAEAKRIDKAATDSELGVTARGLQDGIERALGFHARYLKLPSGGSIEINRDFDSMLMESDVMQGYAALARDLGLPIRVVLDELQKGGRIAPDADLEELELEIMANQEAKMEQERQAQEAKLNAQQKALEKAA